jgi:Tfp pilus assembly protein PilE
MEVMVVLTIMGVLISISMPSFRRTLEQAKADIAGANLQAIWAAQRVYWLEQRVYAPDVATLVGGGLLDPSLQTTSGGTSATPSYTYTITTPSDESSFTATATRAANSSWTGSFSIDQTGTLTGSLQASGETALVPGLQ